MDLLISRRLNSSTSKLVKDVSFVPNLADFKAAEKGKKAKMKANCMWLIQ